MGSIRSWQPCPFPRIYIYYTHSIPINRKWQNGDMRGVKNWCILNKFHADMNHACKNAVLMTDGNRKFLRYGRMKTR